MPSAPVRLMSPTGRIHTFDYATSIILLTQGWRRVVDDPKESSDAPTDQQRA